MPASSIRLIIAPYHAGVYNHRVGGGPIHILSHGLVSRLERLIPVSFANIGPVEEFEGEIGRTFEHIRRISAAVSAAVAQNAFPIILSGNCSASAAAVSGLGIPPKDLGVLWFDAHDDLDTPETDVSGYLDSMAASMMCGSSWSAMMKTVPGFKPLPLSQVAFIGVRRISESKRKWIKEQGLTTVWGDPSRHVDFTAELDPILERLEFRRSHVHLDVDVLDESLGRANEWPSPGGLYAQDLLNAMTLIPTRVTPTSLTVCSFDPRLEGADTIARLVVQSLERFVQGLVDRKAIVTVSK
ncbi:hypothetical protein B0J13DRAFT_293035 [Dactylonectria estremocensis]|uniref:Arginase n=1 Tax=Dactylonectria estremocensis TaxID=1079267 RepID=A0A9P9D084_9HYPO|nr:hypothetical protein B0J13DRAFT_293035 [Dactylonectria estremocensis]